MLFLLSSIWVFGTDERIGDGEETGDRMQSRGRDRSGVLPQLFFHDMTITRGRGGGCYINVSIQAEH